jgi:DNA polymerase elongation subunit (family B)
MNRSFIDCYTCELCENKQQVCCTDCEDNLNDVDVVIFTSISEQQEQIIEFVKKRYKKYFLTSAILCNDSLVKTRKKLLDKCSKNLTEMISICNPSKLIVIGELSESYAKKNCKDFKYEFFKEVESFLSQPELATENEIDAFTSSIMNELKMPEQVNTISEPTIQIQTNEVYKYKIPPEFYTKDYRLIDVQYINSTQQVIYTFRNKENQKIYHEVPVTNDNYYWYESSGTTKNIEKILDLKLVIGNFKNRNQGPFAYESDISIQVKHSVDYYLQSQGETLMTKNNILFFDIEVYTYGDKIFPTPEKSAYPINAISFSYNGEFHTYLLLIKDHIDSKINNILKDKKFPSLTVFDSEITLLKAFTAFVKNNNPDFYAGWNCSKFDIPYIFNRMKKLGLNPNELSDFNFTYYDVKHETGTIIGSVIMDQMKLYKDFTYSGEESYSLNNIANKVLNKRKVEYEGNLNTIYKDNIETFIHYSMTDVELIESIDRKLSHIATQDELRIAATTTQSGAQSTLGLADGLFLFSAKNKGLTIRNRSHGVQKEKLPGAYVYEPNGGLRDGILCDFDFTSLYPSIINSWNIGPNTLLGKVSYETAFQYLYEKDKLMNSKIEYCEDPIHNKKVKKITLIELDEIISKNKATVNISGCLFKNHDIEESIYYPIIKELFTNRKKYKKMMFQYKENKDEINTIIYNCKQMAMKILANSLYGILGNEYFRFYNIDLARSITLTGQELIKYCGVHCNRYLSNESGEDSGFMKSVEQPMKYVVYGDTDSIFVDLSEYLSKKKIKLDLNDDVIREVSIIQNYINKELLNNFAIKHNLSLDRSMIEMKNEFLFSMYYSLNAKKKYAAKVIAQEGKPFSFIEMKSLEIGRSDIEIKGLETRRSDIPKISKDMLHKLLDMIFNKVKISQIKAYVKEVEDQARNLVMQGDLSVARPVSFNKDIDDYKNMPQHIKAMLMWNCLVNEDFREGVKGKLYTLKTFDLDKAPSEIQANYHNKFLKKYQLKDITAIVIPEDVKKLPDYFIPDMDEMIRYAVNDRADLLLEPLVKVTNDFILF